jgi:multiple sugar transport system substrate-binding protein
VRRHSLVPLLAFVALSCAGVQDDTITLRFWGMGREGEVVGMLIPEFERLNPGIKVRVQQIPWTAAHEKMLTSFVGDASPDVAQLGNTWIAEFATLNALVPLDGRVATSSIIAPDDFFPGIWATNVMNDSTYGIPWYVDTRLVFYRTDLLARAGWNRFPESWDEWLAAMRAMRALGGERSWPLVLPLNEWIVPVVLGLQGGSPLLREGGRYGAFSEPAFREAFELYISLFREGLAPPFGEQQIGNIHQEFAAGTFAMYVTGPWQIGEFRRRLPAEMQDRWMTAPMPGPTGAESAVSLAGGASLVLFRASRHPDAAWKLIEYLASPEAQLRFHELTGNLPAREEAWDDSELATDRHARAFREQLERVVPLPMVPEIEDIVKRVQEYAEQAARGAMTTDEALAALDAHVDRILEKRRWMLARQEEQRAALAGPGVR